MGKTARTTARLDNAEAHAHADTTAAREVASVEQSGDYPEGAPVGDEDGRITIGLGALSEMLAQMPKPAALIGEAAAADVKQMGLDFVRAAMQMDALHTDGRRSLAYEYQGRVIVRTQGRFLQSQARSLLTQAYYAMRSAVREYRRFKLLDDTMRLARQTAYHVDRPGAAAEGVTEANWIDGDDRFDPAKAAADRAANALVEALPYVAAAFALCGKVPTLTDGEPITVKIRPMAPAEAGPKPETMADRMRAAPAATAAEFVQAAE